MITKTLYELIPNTGAFKPALIDFPDMGFPLNHKAGLITSNNTVAPNNDIDIAPGEARSDDDTTDMVLVATLTKRLDVVWAEGTNLGGLDIGVKTSNTLYAIWLIKNISSGIVDVLFSVSFSLPIMPAGYTVKRLIGAIVTEVNSFIIAYKQSENYFRLLFPDFEVQDSSIVTGVWETVTLRVPPLCLADLYLEGGTSAQTQLIVHIRTKGAGDPFSSSRSSIGLSLSSLSKITLINSTLFQLVDENKQIEYTSSGTGTAQVTIVLKGFYMLTITEPLGPPLL